MMYDSTTHQLLISAHFYHPSPWSIDYPWCQWVQLNVYLGWHAHTVSMVALSFGYWKANYLTTPNCAVPMVYLFMYYYCLFNLYLSRKRSVEINNLFFKDVYCVLYCEVLKCLQWPAESSTSRIISQGLAALNAALITIINISGERSRALSSSRGRHKNRAESWGTVGLQFFRCSTESWPQIKAAVTRVC